MKAKKANELSWIRGIVRHVSIKYNLGYFNFDDLVSCACIAYCEAKKRFDDTRECTFHSYVFHRIRGAVLDEVRKNIGDKRNKGRPLNRVYFNLEDLEDNGENETNCNHALDLKRFVERCNFDKEHLRTFGYILDGLTEDEISNLDCPSGENIKTKIKVLLKV